MPLAHIPNKTKFTSILADELFGQYKTADCRLMPKKSKF